MEREVRPVHIFVGSDRFPAYIDAIHDVQHQGRRLISPGGAASELRCTRQYVHQLCKAGYFEAWVYYERPVAQPSYFHIDYDQLLAFEEGRKKKEA